MRTGARPPSIPGGTTTASCVLDAKTTRASVSLMRTSGSTGPSIEKSDPRMDTRPPSMACVGVISVTREADMGKSRRGEGLEPEPHARFRFSLRIVELDVPVEVVAPAFGRFP
jgi:hypothetical protein